MILTNAPGASEDLLSFNGYRQALYATDKNAAIKFCFQCGNGIGNGGLGNK